MNCDEKKWTVLLNGSTCLKGQVKITVLPLFTLMSF